MDLQSPNAEDQTPGRQPFQFSLGFLLLLMTATAVFLSALFGGTDWMVTATVYMLFTGWPMALTVVLIYGRGWRRTFCIGALFPTLPLLLSPSSVLSILAYGWGRSGLVFGFQERLRMGFSCLVMFAISIVCGVAALGVRRMVESSARRHKPNAAVDDASE